MVIWVKAGRVNAVYDLITKHLSTKINLHKTLLRVGEVG